MMIMIILVTQQIPTMTKTHHGGNLSVMNMVGICRWQNPTIDNDDDEVMFGVSWSTHHQHDNLLFHLHNLKRHMMAHNGEKSYNCTQCNCASYEAGNFRKHLGTHTGKTPTNATNAIMHHEKPYATNVTDSQWLFLLWGMHFESSCENA